MQSIAERNIPLVCTHCKSELQASDSSFFCSVCKKEYSIKNGIPYFFAISGKEGNASPDDFIYRVKTFFKKYPAVFLILYHTIAIFTGKTARGAISTLPSTARIINVGSGVKVIDDRVINVDVTPAENVHIVASVYELPFKDNSIDAVIAESLFEHLLHPSDAAKEIHRVLKPNGIFYITTPFMLGFHSSPDDFYRWTIPGLKQLLKDFSINESGVAVGPTGAMVAMLREWLAMLLSFGSSLLYQLWTMLFMILFIPLNILDFILVRFSFASTIAHSYYVIGRKTL